MAEIAAVERGLAEYIVTTEFEDLPLATRMKSCKQILWTIGVAIAGSNAQGSHEIVNYVKSLGGAGRSSIWGTDIQTAPFLAAMANSSFAKAFEMEDKVYIGGSSGFGTGPACVATTLALAEELGEFDNEKVIAAISIAAEIEGILGRAIEEPLRYAPCAFVTGPVLAVFGATAAASKMLGLSIDETHYALGNAYAQATGFTQPGIEGGMGVRMQLAYAVRNGIMAAQLAKAGITGMREFLTGVGGLFPLFFPGREIDWELIQSPGKDYYRDAGYKAFPSCLVSHGAVTAMRELVGQFDPEEVERVIAFGAGMFTKLAIPREIRINPKDFVQAQFSVPWALACVMRDGDLGLQHYSNDSLANEKYRKLAALVEVDAQDGREFSAVEVVLRNGTTLSSSKVKWPLGHPNNPFSEEVLLQKYSSSVAFGATEELAAQLEEIPQLLLTDNGVPDIAGVIARLRSSSIADNALGVGSDRNS